MGACLSKPSVAVAAEVPPAQDPPKQTEPPNASTATPSTNVVEVQKGSAAEEPQGAVEAEEYCGACAPVCELQRRQHLLDLNILHTEPESRFDDITKLCTMVFKVPIALVSLVDTQIQWFKSVQGLTVDRTPRNTSFCAWTLLPANPEALIVEDAQHDARFKDNPLVVGAPHIRFYAGCPLVCSNGMRLGSLCIIDKQPRTFDAESCNMLANMAEMVVREIEKDSRLELQHQVKVAAERESAAKHERQKLLRGAINSFTDAILLVDTSDERWPVIFSNEALDSMVGRKREAGSEPGFWEIFQMPASGSNSQNHSKDFLSAIAQQQSFEMLVSFSSSADGMQQGGNQGQSLSYSFAKAQFRCAANTGLDSHMPLIGIPNFLPSTAEGTHAFYFVTVQLVKPAQNSGGSASSSGTVRRKAPRMASFSIMTGSEPFADVKLGPLLGKGAFGRVYRGSWNGRMVAVKVIEYSQRQNEDGCLLEGLLSEQVQHTHVVRTYKYATRPLQMACGDGYDDEDDECAANGLPGVARSGEMQQTKDSLMETWLVLEYCNKGQISDAISKGWFRRRGSKAEADMGAILATAREVAGALAYLHTKNILHGDLTGNNILLTANASEKRGFMAKVSDFGLSRLLTNEAPVIETRTYGTVTHMPPELLLEGHMSKAVDVYSFGVVLWEMYTGRAPYIGLSHSQVLHMVNMGKMLELPESAPSAFRQLVSSCLARNPADRPSCAQVLVQLDAMIAQDMLWTGQSRAFH